MAPSRSVRYRRAPSDSILSQHVGVRMAEGVVLAHGNGCKSRMNGIQKRRGRRRAAAVMRDLQKIGAERVAIRVQGALDGLFDVARQQEGFSPALQAQHQRIVVRR